MTVNFLNNSLNVSLSFLEQNTRTLMILHFQMWEFATVFPLVYTTAKVQKKITTSLCATRNIVGFFDRFLTFYRPNHHWIIWRLIKYEFVAIMFHTDLKIKPLNNKNVNFTAILTQGDDEWNKVKQQKYGLILAQMCVSIVRILKQLC